jgi:hypothetical protein
MAETAKNSAKTNDAAPPGVSFGDDSAPPGVSFGDDTAAPPGVSFGDVATPAKPEHKFDPSKFVFDPMSGAMGSTDPEDDKLLRQQTLEQYKGLPSGAAKTVVGWAQLPALAMSDHIQQYLADTQANLSKIGTKEGQLAGEALPYLFGGGAVRALGAGFEGAMGLARIAPGAAKVGEFLAPAGEFLAPAGEALSATGKAIKSGAKTAVDYAGKAIPESAKNLYRGITGTAPKAEAATAEALAAEAAAAPEKLAKLKVFGKALADIGVETGKGVISGAAGGAAFGAVAPREEATQLERNNARINSMIKGAEGGAWLGGGFGFGGEALKNIVRAKNAASLKEQEEALGAAKAALEKERARLEKLTSESYLRAAGKESGADVARQLAEAKLNPMEQKIGELTEEGFKTQRRELEARKRIFDDAGNADPTKLSARADMSLADAKNLVASHEQAIKTLTTEMESLSAEFADLPRLTPVEQNKLMERVQASLDNYKLVLDNNVKIKSGYKAFENKYKNAGQIFPVENIKRIIDSKLTAGLELTDADYLMAEVAKKIDAKTKSGTLSFDQMDELRKYVNDAIEKGIVQRGGRPRSIAGDELQKLMPLKEEILKSINSVDNTFNTVLNRYGSAKSALDSFSEGNVFAGLTDKKFGKQFAMLPGDALVQLLGQTEKGSEGVAAWVAQDKSAQDKIRQFLITELFPTKTAASKVTAGDFENFMRNRGNIIEKAGLLPEFNELASMQQAAEQRISGAEQALESARQKAARATEKLDIPETERKLELAELESRSKPVRAEVASAANDLAAAKSMKDSTDRLAGDLRNAKMTPDTLHTELDKFIDHLNAYDPENFTNAMRETAKADLIRMQKEYTTSRDDLKYLKDLRTYAFTRLAANLGFGVTGYGVYRLGQGPGGTH